jgi:hypothetical protein
VASSVTVASALRYVAKEVIGSSRDSTGSSRKVGSAKGNIQSTKGIGIDLVVRFLSTVPGVTEKTVQQHIAILKDVPDVNESTVKQHIAILKASGDYRWRSPRPRLGVRDRPRL